MLITCTECGCPYESYMLCCPECGCPTEIQNVGQVTVTNCVNCGAPVGKGDCCEYCGSTYPRIVRQAPQQVIINNNQQTDTDSVAIASFLGGLVGGALRS